MLVFIPVLNYVVAVLGGVIEIIESDKTLEAQLNGDVIHNLHINKQNIAKDDPDIEVLKCFLV